MVLIIPSKRALAAVMRKIKQTTGRSTTSLWPEGALYPLGRR